MKRIMGSTSTLAQSDVVVANEERIKAQKKKVSQLYKQLRNYTEAYRKFLSARQGFFRVLDDLYETGWDDKTEFSNRLKKLSTITEEGVVTLETSPVEETITFKDKFGPIEKEIKEYKDRAKQHAAAEKKAQAYRRKKTTDADELRRLDHQAYEKKTSLDRLQEKLKEELPTFYNSRMEFYARLWRTVFDTHLGFLKKENDMYSLLLGLVRAFDTKRLEGAYDAAVYDDISGLVDMDDGDYENLSATDAAGGSGSEYSGESFYAQVQRLPSAARGAEALASGKTPPVPTKPLNVGLED